MTDDAEDVDPEAAARAQAIVESMRGKFLDWLKTTEAALGDHLTTLESGGNAADQQAAVEAVTVIAHEMRGLGGTFGYPLVTRVGATLEDYLLARADASTDVAADAAAVDVHIIAEHIAAVGDMRAAFAVDLDDATERRLSDIADRLEVLTGA